MLTEKQLQGLASHQYSMTGRSILDTLLQPFWNFVVTLVPLWVAPNLLTLVGLAMNVGSSLAVVYYCPTGKGEAPAWAYATFALGLFFYQTLDAIDGKQARRTKTASPLGELFDHGCDAISTVFVVIATVVCSNMGGTPLAVGLACTFMCCYFAAHWQAYVTGTLEFGTIDVTEGQYGVISMALTTAVMGPQVWDQEVMAGVPLRLVVLGLTLAGMLYTLARTLHTIFVKHATATVARTSVASPLFPLLVLLASVYYTFVHSDDYREHFCLFMFTFGFAFAKISCQMVVAMMSKSPFPLTDSVLFAPVLLALNLYCHLGLHELYLLAACCVWTGLSLTHYCVVASKEMADHLNIRVLSIDPPKPEGAHSH